jgi:hypothetical protein
MDPPKQVLAHQMTKSLSYSPLQVVLGKGPSVVTIQ